MLKFAPLVLKQVIRHRTRSALTVLGVATGMFLFATVQAMQGAVTRATSASSEDTTLVVYRENRYCPATSRLPERYLSRIAAIEGVRNVTPMKIVVNNCRASLDVITFRGLPEEKLAETGSTFRYVSGSAEAWKGRSDAALVGETLAKRRGFKAGDRFTAAGVTVFVAGVIASSEPQDQNVAYVHLPFLQRAAGEEHIGTVTQFNVKVDDPQRMEAVAAAIDDLFRSDSDPTSTRSEKAFVARAAADVVAMVGFASVVGWGCLAAVFALVGNAIVLSVHDRIREHAVLQTLGFGSGLIARLIMAEGVLMGLIGGAIGCAAAMGMMWWGRFSMSVEGVNMPIEAGVDVLLMGLAASMGLGIAAGLAPAWRASRREITSCFRAV